MSDAPAPPRGPAPSIPTLTDVVVEGRPQGERAPPLSVPLRAARTGAARPAPPQADPETASARALPDTAPARSDTARSDTVRSNTAGPDTANPDIAGTGAEAEADARLIDAVAERLRTRLTRQLSDAVDAALMLHGPQIAETVQRQIEPWLRTEIAAELRRQARARVSDAPPPAGD